VQVGDLVQSKYGDKFGLGLVIQVSPTLGGHDPTIIVQWANGQIIECWFDSVKEVSRTEANK
jgi:uncharacterized protein YycO